MKFFQFEKRVLVKISIQHNNKIFHRDVVFDGPKVLVQLESDSEVEKFSISFTFSHNRALGSSPFRSSYLNFTPQEYKRELEFQVSKPKEAVFFTYRPPSEKQAAYIGPAPSPSTLPANTVIVERDSNNNYAKDPQKRQYIYSKNTRFNLLSFLDVKSHILSYKIVSTNRQEKQQIDSLIKLDPPVSINGGLAFSVG